MQYLNKNSLVRFNSRMEVTEGRVGELEDKLIERLMSVY